MGQSPRDPSQPTLMHRPEVAYLTRPVNLLDPTAYSSVSGAIAGGTSPRASHQHERSSIGHRLSPPCPIESRPQVPARRRL